MFFSLPFIVIVTLISRLCDEIQKLAIDSMTGHCCQSSPASEVAGKGCSGPCGLSVGVREGRRDTEHLEQKYVYEHLTVSACLTEKKQNITIKGFLWDDGSVSSVVQGQRQRDS